MLSVCVTRRVQRGKKEQMKEERNSYEEFKVNKKMIWNEGTAK